MSRYSYYTLDMISQNNITETFKVLQDPIRIRIIEMLQYEHDRREFIPDSIEAKDGFCPMDILMVLHEEGINISNTKLSYHLKRIKRKKHYSFIQRRKTFLLSI